MLVEPYFKNDWNSARANGESRGLNVPRCRNTWHGQGHSCCCGKAEEERTEEGEALCPHTPPPGNTSVPGSASFIPPPPQSIFCLVSDPSCFSHCDFSPWYGYGLSTLHYWGYLSAFPASPHSSDSTFPSTGTESLILFPSFEKKKNKTPTNQEELQTAGKGLGEKAQGRQGKVHKAWGRKPRLKVEGSISCHPWSLSPGLQRYRGSDICKVSW